MSRSRRKKERRCKGRIDWRLRNRNWEDQPEAMFSASNIHYEIDERTRVLGPGGIGAIHRMVHKLELNAEIDARLSLLKKHLPYHESDHVLNIAYNLLCGGHCLEDIELWRNDENYMNALGAQRIPDPTTEGDFCRRFEPEDVEQLMSAINATRLRAWQRQPEGFFAEAAIDADGTLVPTNDGIDACIAAYEWTPHGCVCLTSFNLDTSGERLEDLRNAFDNALWRGVILVGPATGPFPYPSQAWAHEMVSVVGCNAVGDPTCDSDPLFGMPHRGVCYEHSDTPCQAPCGNCEVEGGCRAAAMIAGICALACQTPGCSSTFEMIEMLQAAGVFSSGVFEIPIAEDGVEETGMSQSSGSTCCQNQRTPR